MTECLWKLPEDVLRDAVKKQTELGRKADEYMKKGELVPDDLIVGLIENKIKDGELSKGFILDGFPRTIPQAESLKAMLHGNGVSLDKAMLFVVSDEEIVKRLSGRWYCPVCNAGYNYPMQIPKVEGHCDHDNAELKRRPDDDEAVVRNRLEVYKKQTQPIEDYYRKEAILVEIEAQVAPDEVFKRLLHALD